MRLTKIWYSEFETLDHKWIMNDLELGQINLLVGKNATGKTRVLNVIAGLGRILLNPIIDLASGHYRAEFVDEGKNLSYELQVSDKMIVLEKLIIDGEEVLTRNSDGDGLIKYCDENRFMRFQAPSQILAASTRRDKLQHPFLEPIYAWAAELRHYRFNSESSKHSVMLVVDGGPKVDERNQAQVAGLFKHAINTYGVPFVEAIKRDLEIIDYFVDDIFLKPPVVVKIEGAPGPFLALCVKERDLSTYTDQFAMSDGMYRAVTNLIFVNYYKFSGLAGTLIIDDIGEGLDFDRSCRLIKLLREKSLETKVQLIIATNDKFVMNLIPLEEWSVLERKGCIVSIRNHKNSQNAFDEFRYTGLSNFSFLELDV